MGTLNSVIQPPEYQTESDSTERSEESEGDNTSDDDAVYEINMTFFSKDNDTRPFAKVKLNDKQFTGLLDSGANISILGKDNEDFLKDTDVDWRKVRRAIRRVRTADGTTYEMDKCGKFMVEFNGVTKCVKIYIIPAISQQLILGTNFWRAFNIEPVQIENPNTQMCSNQVANNKLLEIKAIEIANPGDAVPNAEDIAQLAEIADEIDPETPKYEARVYHNLSAEQQKCLDEVKSHFNFSDPDKLGFTPLIEHVIDTGDHVPIKQKQYINSPYIQKPMNEEIDRMLKLGIIEKASCPKWLNPVIPVKKSDGRIRICLDARKLNKCTVKNAYPQQNLNRILQQYRGTKYISTIDLSDAYYQIKIAKQSRECTAFAVSSKGTFQYKRMANGLTNASASLCELIQNIIGNDLEPKVFPYMDDFLILTDSFEEHLEVLKELAKRLKTANLTVSSTKCFFCMKRTSYVGYTISEKGIQANPERIKPILQMPSPTNLKAVRRLMGMSGWYRRFIPDFASIVSPITETLKKENSPFKWTPEAEQALDKLKNILTTAPILASPNFDLPFSLHTDASDFGVGAVLTQNIDNEERVIAFFSAKLNKAQKHYTTTEKECLAVILSIEKFRPYLDGVKFVVYTDHASLVWLQNMKEPTSRLARWALRLASYDFELIHRKGKDMIVPDCLSRVHCDAIDLQSFKNSADTEYANLIVNTEKNNDPGPYRVLNDLLYLQIRGKYGNALRLYVPSDFRIPVLRDCHDDVLAGHHGYWKTLKRIQENYTWPTMAKDTLEYTAKCEECQAAKPGNKNPINTMGNFRDPMYPWRTIAIDFVGPLVRSKKGHAWLLTIVDVCSKYAIAFPLRHATAELTIDRLKKHVFYIYGVPEKIICDNGSQFKSHMFQAFTEKFHVEINFCASYHPQANPAEAFNKILGTALKLYVEDKQHNTWDEKIPQLLCAINSSTHTQTKKTPYEAIYGHKYISNGQWHKAMADVNNRTQEDIEHKLPVLWTEIRESLKTAYDRASRQFNKKANEISYQIGDTVWKRNTVLSDKSKKQMSKLNKRFIKCTVVAVPAHNMYTLTDYNTKKELGNFASNELKPARTMPREKQD